MSASKKKESLNSLLSDLASIGYLKEAEEIRTALVKEAAMSADMQETQMDVFRRVLSHSPVDTSSLKLDASSRIMSFDVTGMGFLSTPPFLERVMNSLDKNGVSKYTLVDVRRGLVRIKMG